MKVLDLFAGIGGFTVGMERAGLETVAFCEIDPYAQKVLRKNWPTVPIFDDVRKLYRVAGDLERCECCGDPWCDLCEEHFGECECHGIEELEESIGTIDVVTSGFPCQDVSVAGNKAGINAGRTSLYRESLRIIGYLRPRFAVFENVTGLIQGDSGRWFAQFLADLAAIGLNAEWHCISASELGAYHHRDRVWVISYADADGFPSSEITESDHQGGDSHKEGEIQTMQSSGRCSSDVPQVLADSDIECQSVRDDESESQGSGEASSGGKESSRGSDCERALLADSDGESGEHKAGGLEGVSENSDKSHQQEEREAPFSTNSEHRCETLADSETVLEDSTSVGQQGSRERIESEHQETARNWKASLFESKRIRGEWLPEPDLGRVANGIPNQSHRLRLLGNAVCPANAELIGRIIMDSVKDD